MDTFYLVLTIIIALIASPFLIGMASVLAHIISNIFGSGDQE